MLPFCPTVIPFIDASAQYTNLQGEIDTAVHRVLRSGQYVLGPEGEAFESEFAQRCHVAHAVGVNSGTSALYLALLAAGIGPGDEVITVPFTFEATVAAIQWTGARVRLVDVEVDSLTMNVDQLEQRITADTKAVVPVHLFGHPAEMRTVRAIADQHELLVIEDACQAHGALYADQPVGSLGDLGCFSFYPTKTLATCGEGGMVVTNNPRWAERLRQLRSWGGLPHAGNYRLPELAAAILRVKLPHVDAWVTARRSIAKRYGQQLADLDITLPGAARDVRHAFSVYGIRTPHRERLATALRTRGVAAAVHYAYPAHLLPAYRELGYLAGTFPVAETAAHEELSLPIYPELSDDALATIISAVHQGLPG